MRSGSILVLVALGCGGDAVPTGPSEPIAPVPDGVPVAAHMKEHFDMVVAARDAVIRGRPEEAREPLMALASYPTAAGLPGDWQPYIAEMRTLAGDGASIENDESGGRAVGLVAGQCGACHAAVDAKLMPPPVHVPRGEAIEDHMGRHAFAADRMWWSLVVPDASLWEEAAAVLAEEPIAALPGPDGPEPIPADLAVYAARVHELAVSGLRSPQPSARAELYGQMLASCGACHRARGVDPFPK